jgi:ATP-binding cassette subfamily B protein
MFVAAIPGALVRLIYARKSFRFEQEHAQTERRSWYNHWLVISSDYAKEIRLFDLGHLFINRYKELRKNLRIGRLSLARKRVTVDFFAQSLATLAIFFALGLAAYQAILGLISVGDLIAIYMGFQVGLTSMQAILRSLAGLYEDNLFLEHFYQFLELEPQIMGSSQNNPPPEKIQAGIKFEGVCFEYPNSARKVLQDLSFSIQPGRVIALVGANGSGKTTLVKLLCRLYDPKEGKISIDGIDLKEVDPTKWRKKISVIFQDFARYQLSAWENIWLGNANGEPDMQAIKQAARKSGADGFIQQLPEGYQTNLGTWFEDGLDLSGGEWQKIALARAFIRDTEIVILDEPTSSLDPLAEAELFHQFRRLIQGKSAILISHRFSTVEMADEIYVLDGGKIIECGSHQQLIKLGGEYARFYLAQAQHFEKQ